MEKDETKRISVTTLKGDTLLLFADRIVRLYVRERDYPVWRRRNPLAFWTRKTVCDYRRETTPVLEYDVSGTGYATETFLLDGGADEYERLKALLIISNPSALIPQAERGGTGRRVDAPLELAERFPKPDKSEAAAEVPDPVKRTADGSPYALETETIRIETKRRKPQPKRPRHPPRPKGNEIVVAPRNAYGWYALMNSERAANSAVYMNHPKGSSLTRCELARDLGLIAYAGKTYRDSRNLPEEVVNEITTFLQWLSRASNGAHDFKGMEYDTPAITRKAANAAIRWLDEHKALRRRDAPREYGATYVAPYGDGKPKPVTPAQIDQARQAEVTHEERTMRAMAWYKPSADGGMSSRPINPTMEFLRAEAGRIRAKLGYEGIQPKYNDYRELRSYVLAYGHIIDPAFYVRLARDRDRAKHQAPSQTAVVEPAPKPETPAP